MGLERLGEKLYMWQSGWLKQVNGQTERRTYGETDRLMERQTDEQTKRWTNGQMNRQIYGQTEKWTN